MIGMFNLRLSPTTFISLESIASCRNTRNTASVVVCAAKGPRPRYPRVWKVNKKFGTISKSTKLVECVKGLSNVKEEVYGALDSFIAWELEFPLITVKKALKLLENEREWKRIIQVTKWMLSKGQGRTMGSYYALLNALAADGRIDEAEELWNKLFSENLESMPRTFFDKMISVYYKNGMHEKMFEIFADMEELGVKPNVSIVSMVGDVFQKLDMMDKYAKLKKKYPPPKWEYRYVKGKRVKVQARHPAEFDNESKPNYSTQEKDGDARKPYIRSAEEKNYCPNLESEESEVHAKHLLDIESKTDNDKEEEDDDASKAFDDPTEETSYDTDLAYEESETDAYELYVETNLSR